jgi:HEAT repeat protein
MLRSREPEYQGRTISAWQSDWAAKKKQSGFPAALQHIGTNALPFAVRDLALNDSWWRSNYARLQAKLPSRLQGFSPKLKPHLKEVDGANVFFYLGSNSMPQAIALLKHDSPTVRRSAAMGIGALRRQSAAAEAIPALIGGLADRDWTVRFQAALALQNMGSGASNAVPALARVVANTGVGPETNNFFHLRAAAAVALGKIGPSATKALPVLETAVQESHSYLRGAAAVAIWRIGGNAETALPVLLREMPGTSEHSKWDWIIALGEMGYRAKAAIPQLKSELERDNEKWVLNYVTNALKSIGPEISSEAGVK